MTLASVAGQSLRFSPAGDRAARLLIVLLHGVGSSAAAMAPFGETIASAIEGAAVTVVNGFERFDVGRDGYQWFSVAGVTENNRPERVARALPRLEEAIEQEQTRLGLGPEQTIVIGFSQGAIMALHLGATAIHPPAIIVSIAGRLAAHLQPTRGRGPSVLLSHGEADGVISSAEMAFAAAELGSLGLPVETQLVPSHGHGIDPQQVARIIDYVRLRVDDFHLTAARSIQ